MATRSRYTSYDLERMEPEPLKDWLKQGRDWLHQEYVRVIPNANDRTLTLYRSLGDDPDDGYTKTVLRDVTINTHGDRRPAVYHLHGQDANTVITLLESLKNERSPARVALEYWSDAGRQLMKGTGVTEETFRLGYDTESGRQFEVRFSSVYRDDTQRIVRF